MAIEQLEHDHDVHVTPIGVYVTVYIILLIGLVLTVAVSYVHLGWLNTPIAMAIAIGKAALVILYFMHLKHSTKLTQVWAAISLVFLLTLFLLSLSDYWSRWFWNLRY